MTAIVNPEILSMLRGDRRQWADLEDGEVSSATLYLAQGCADWGQCTFCGLPDAVNWFTATYNAGRPFTAEEHEAYFRANLREMDGIHTLMVFNAGSFFADKVNPPRLRESLLRAVAEHPSIRRLVVESRAPLLSADSLRSCEPLLRAGKRITVRIGMETFDDDLRNKKLRKGFTRAQIKHGVSELHSAGIEAGAYTLLQPVPGLDPQWAVEEGARSIFWALGEGGFDEVYFGPTCVPSPMPGEPPRPIYLAWEAGEFRPATLWMTWTVLREAAGFGPERLHLLPFKDQPPFVAVPSNHVVSGIPETLEGAMGCDREFHDLLSRFRMTKDVADLSPPSCDCRPAWIR